MSSPRDLICEFAPGAGPADVIGEHYMVLDGVSGTNATTPDTASLDITGDIDVRVDARLPLWHPPVATSASLTTFGRPLAAKWLGTGDQRSWALVVGTGALAFGWCTAGTIASIRSAAVVAPTFLTKNRRLILRVTLDVNDGAGGHVVTFMYTDPATGGTVDSGPWTTIQTTTGAGTTSIFSSSAAVQVGEITDASANHGSLTGWIYQVQVRSGIGGAIATNPNFAAQANGTTGFSDSATRPWTLAGNAEIVGYDWVDLSDRLLVADWSYGRDDELADYGPGEATLRLKNDDRVLDPDHTAGTYAGQLVPRVPFRLRSIASALDLPGSGGSYAGTPDHASLAVTDLDVRVRLAMDDWTPGFLGQFLVGQWPNSAGNNGWVLAVNSAGTLGLTFTTDGTTSLARNSTAATGFTDGTDHWVRATLDANNGAGGHDVRFYTSSDGVDWTQLGTTVTTAGTVSLFNSTADLRIGDVLLLAGQVRYVEVRNGIDGTVVAAPDFMAQAPGASSFRDGTGKLWTLAGAAQIALDTTVRSDEFYGFVNSPWRQELAPPERCDCVVELVDRLGVTGGYELPDIFDQAILDRSPTGYWVLKGDSDTEQVPDLGSGLHDAAVTGNVKFGERPIRSGHPESALFSSTSGETGLVEVSTGPPVVTGDMSQVTVVATFKLRTPPAVSVGILAQHDNGNTSLTGWQIYTNTLGQIGWFWLNSGTGGQRVLTADQWDSGTGHILFAQDEGFAIDAATFSSTSLPLTTTSDVANGMAIGGFFGGIAATKWDGWIGALAVLMRRLGQGERQLILDAYERLDGSRSDEHIAWALDEIGVVPEHRNLAQGSVLMGPARTAGEDGLEWIRAVVATEQGEWYVDHRDGGKLRFRDRYARFTATRSTTRQIMFSDDPANTEPVVRVERDDFELDPNGTESLINQANVEWRDGTETVEDITSRNRYGPRPRSITTEATAAATARSVGEWAVARRKDPRSLVRGIGVHPAAARDGYQAVHHLQVGDRSGCRYHPQQVGTATTTDVFVEGISHHVEGVDWETHYATSPVDTFTPARWDVSTWDVTAFWG